MSNEKADNQTYGASPQGSEYGYVHRSFCRPAEEPARKGGTLRRRTGGTFGDSEKDSVQLGKCHQVSIYRTISATCRVFGHYDTNTDAERVVNVLSSSPYLTPIFQESVKFSSVYIPTFVERRDFARFYVPEFQESKDFSERIFAKFTENFPIGHIPLLSYSRLGITIHPVNTIVGIPTAYSAPVRLARSDSIDI